MRAFLGISISEDLKHRILNIQKKFSNFDIKFVESENLHFNLKFFEDIGNEELKKLKTVLDEVVKKFEPFEIEIKGIGVFPNKNYIRVAVANEKENQIFVDAMSVLLKAHKNLK